MVGGADRHLMQAHVQNVWSRAVILPFMTIACPFSAGQKAPIFSAKWVSNSRGERASKTCRMVSWSGMPLRSPRYRRIQDSRALPQSSISSQSSAPDMTAHYASTTASSRSWSAPISSRGSGRSPNRSISPSIVFSSIHRPQKPREDAILLALTNPYRKR